jgi:hypothetical protein
MTKDELDRLAARAALGIVDPLPHFTPTMLDQAEHVSPTAVRMLRNAHRYSSQARRLGVLPL